MSIFFSVHIEQKYVHILNCFRLRELNYEKRALEVEINTSNRELGQVRSIEAKKIETLAKLLPNGQDAVKAMKWLENNKDQFCSQVYDPMLMGIDVQDAANYAKV